MNSPDSTANLKQNRKRAMDSNSEVTISLGKLAKRSFTFSDLAKSNNGTLDDLRVQAARANFSTIVKNLQDKYPKLPASLCFVDFIFFLGMSNETRQRKQLNASKTIPATGYFAGCSEGSSDVFMTAVREHFKSGGVIMNHEGFLAGFPSFSENSAPLESYSKEVLASVCDGVAKNTFPDSIPDVDFHYVEIAFPDVEGEKTNDVIGEVDASTWDYCLIDSDVELLDRSMETGPAESMKEFASRLWKDRDRFNSHSGYHLQYIYFLPMCWFEISFAGDKVSEKLTASPAHGGAVIVGSAHRLANEHCGAVCELFSKSVASTFVTSESLEKGAIQGLGAAIMAFGHQIKTLAAGITGHQKKWLFPASSLERFKDLDRPCEVTPVPELFDALGKTIKFWSLGHKPDSLGIPDEFIDTLADVMQAACGFAESLRLASAYARVDMSNEVNLAALRSEYKVNLNASSLASWKIDASAFSFDDRPISYNRPSYLPWHQLAGLIRFFAIAIEGAIEYAPAFEQPNVDFQVHQNSHRIIITSTNTCKPTLKRNASDARYAGMHGTDILHFICRRFLSSLHPVTVPLDRNTNYSVSLQIDKPTWLELEEVNG